MAFQAEGRAGIRCVVALTMSWMARLSAATYEITLALAAASALSSG